MSKIAVLGLGQFGSRVALELADRGQDVLAVDHDTDVVARLRDRVALAVTADVTDEDAMRGIALDEVDAAVVAIGEQQLVTILGTAILRQIGVPRIVARATTPIQARILTLIGANEVVFPEDEIGVQVANRLVAPDFSEIITLRSGRKVVEIGVQPDWVGRTIGEVGFRRELGVNVIGVKRVEPAVSEDGSNVTENVVNDLPGAEDTLAEGDVLIVMGPAERIDALGATGS